jgi:hypothetical protein
MVTWFKFVPHSRLLIHLATGWMPVADLGRTHGEWAILCEWHGEGEPS